MATEHFSIGSKWASVGLLLGRLRLISPASLMPHISFWLIKICRRRQGEHLYLSLWARFRRGSLSLKSQGSMQTISVRDFLTSHKLCGLLFRSIHPTN